jgi:hypothetical protein
VVKLFHTFYNAAKGVESNKEVSQLLVKQVREVERILTKANETRLKADAESSIGTVEEVVTEALNFVNSLQGKGWFGRLMRAKKDDELLSRLSKQLTEAVAMMTTELTIEAALTPAAITADAEANEMLRQRVHDMGGLDTLDPNDKATMKELCKDLPFKDQMLRSELNHHLEELERQSTAIRAAVEEGPWDVIKHGEVRFFWFKRVKDGEMKASLVVELLMDFLQVRAD